MTEEQLQSSCVQWFWNNYPEQRKMLFHVDNNSWNSVIGSRKKALGVVSGPSDLILILRCRVVFIEMKIPGGVQSDNQKDFEKKVNDRSHQYIIIYSLQEFKNLICQVIGE